MLATSRHLVRESGKQFLPLSVEKTKSKAGVKPILEQWKPTKLKQTNKKYMRNLHTGESIVRLYDILKPLFLCNLWNFTCCFCSKQKGCGVRN